MKNIFVFLLVILSYGVHVSAQITDDDIYTIVETMPRYKGCEDMVDESAATSCTTEKLTAFLKDNIIYPPGAKANKIQGKVYISFIIEKDGSVSHVTILRDIGGGCGDEAVRVIKLLPQFKPGTQNGKPVRVQFRLPVNFTLN